MAIVFRDSCIMVVYVFELVFISVCVALFDHWIYDFAIQRLRLRLFFVPELTFYVESGT